MSIKIDGKVQTVRKINGRWWSRDNRELIQTSEKWLWTISGGNARHLVRFDHHYPFDPAKVELLNRSMGPNEVRGVLGNPNSVFPSDKPEEQQMWDYYASNGYKLTVHFSSSGEGIFNATESPNAHALPKDVPHLAFRFKGKTAQEMAAERKSSSFKSRPAEMTQAEWRKQRLGEREASRAELRSSLGGRSATVTLPLEAPPQRAANSRAIPAEEIARVTPGMSREKLIELLGEPHSRMAIAGVEPVKETLRYQSETGAMITIVVIDGKVAEKPR